MMFEVYLLERIFRCDSCHLLYFEENERERLFMLELAPTKKKECHSLLQQD